MKMPTIIFSYILEEKISCPAELNMKKVLYPRGRGVRGGLVFRYCLFLIRNETNNCQTATDNYTCSLKEEVIWWKGSIISGKRRSIPESLVSRHYSHKTIRTTILQSVQVLCYSRLIIQHSICRNRCDKTSRRTDRTV